MSIVILFLRVTAESTFSTAEEGLTWCSQDSVRQRNPEARDSLSLTHQQKGLEHKPYEPISVEFQNKDYKTTCSKGEGPLGLRERAERGPCSGAADGLFPWRRIWAADRLEPPHALVFHFMETKGHLVSHRGVT